MTTTASIPFSAIDPAAHLPRLENLVKLSDIERHAAIAHWVAWLNGNKQHVDVRLREELDAALTALDRGEVQRAAAGALQYRFDKWLASAGKIGAGRGPDEEGEVPLSMVEEKPAHS